MASALRRRSKPPPPDILFSMKAIDVPRFLLLRHRLIVHGTLPPHPRVEREGVIPLECLSKRAYGCGEHGQKLVEGLSLGIYNGHRFDRPPPSSYRSSALAICLSQDAIRSIEAELGVPGGLEVNGSVLISHQGVIVLHVTFLHRHHSKRTYYLVYDSTDASLYMIPSIPDDELQCMYTLAPLPARASNGGGHVLALLARKRWPHRLNRDRLCLCTPASRADHNAPDKGPWEIKLQRFPEFPDNFSADVMFSMEGKFFFWADLSQGIAYSDLTEGFAVKSDSILLPKEFQINYSGSLDSYQEVVLPRKVVEASRTMGSVEGSIKFVCIDGCLGNWVVKALTLNLDSQQWEEEEGFPCPWIVFWKQVGLVLCEVEPLEPQYPVLMPDGALCIKLQKQGLEGLEYICSFDMRTKKLKSLGFVDLEATGPMILPSDSVEKKLSVFLTHGRS